MRQPGDQSQQALSSLGRTRTGSVDAEASVLSGYSGQRAMIGSSVRIDVGLDPHPSEIYLSFLFHRLFSDPYRDGTTGPWIRRAIGEDTTSVSYNAASCLATALFERVHVLERSNMNYGVIQYCKALRLLNTAIQDPNVCYEPANVVATILLSLYEMIVFINRHGWIQHAGGIEKLIEMRGVDRYRSEPLRHYFIMSRMPIITKVLVLQRRTFLEQGQWKTIPWADEPGSKLSLHFIQDTFASIPGLLKMVTVCKPNVYLKSLDTRAVYRSMLIGSSKSSKELFCWRWEWEQSNPDGAFEARPDSSPLLLDDNYLPTYESVIHYETFEMAREIMLYDTVLLWVLSLAKFWAGEDSIRLALSPFPVQERPPASNCLTLPHEDLTAAEIAREICRSIEYNLLEPHTHSGAMFLMLPLRVVLHFGPADKE